MHGYHIIQELETRSEGAWRPSPGSVYPTLQQLEDEGLVKTVEQEGGRRVFELTDAGRAEADDAAKTPPWEEVAGALDDDLTSLRDLFFQVAAATWQVAQTGSSSRSHRHTRCSATYASVSTSFSPESES
jgi:DNA-binding PadR family transcriptional regulator